jgi:phosphate/phosphite/phosphonate ABC transporter binding protein
MKTNLLIFLLLFAGANVSAAEGVLKFGVAPSNPNSAESLNVLMNFLAEKAGRPFEVVVFDNEELLNKLSTGEIAFADLTSSAFATAQARRKDRIRYIATVAARNEKGELVPYYKGVFFVLKESPYNSLFDLKGKSFGFVSKTSTSGYIYPLAALNNLGINPDTFFTTVTFAGGHAKIFEGLKTGFLDAGVSNYDSLEKAKLVHGNIFRPVGETAEIPSGAFVASSSVDAETVKKVEDALIGIKPADPVVNYPGFIYKGWYKKGGGFYDFIKKLIAKLKIW